MGAAGGRPRGGVTCAVARSVWIQALFLPRLPDLRAGCWGPLPTCCRAGVQVRGPSTTPVTCVPFRGLRAVGLVGGGPRGGLPSTVVSGVWCQATSLPRLPVLGCAGSQGAATRVSRVPFVWAWGPSGGPTACALASCRCALWRWLKGVPGGGAFRFCEGRLSSGAPPPPTARPLGRAAGVPWPVCPGCGWCGCGGPAPASQRAPLRAFVARYGGGRRASLGEVPFAVVRGV